VTFESANGLTRGIGVAFSNYEAYFDPELLRTLQAIFDEAWQEICALPGRAAPAEDADTQRSDLAEMIILAHRSGLPLERIKEVVLGRIFLGTPVAAA
jgi:hypothetical protein